MRGAFWDSNLRALQAASPGLAQRLAEVPPVEVIAGQRGLPTVRARTPRGSLVLLHSAVDPWTEAAGLVGRAQVENKSQVVVLGLGLGYHVRHLLERTRSTAARLLVVERHPELAAAALGNLDLAGLANGRVRLLVGEDPAVVGQALEAFFNPASVGSVGILEHPASVQLDPEYYAQVREEIRKAANAALVATNTVIYYSHAWQFNYILNLPYAVFSPGINRLFDRFSGVPAVVVGAGPSLDKNVHLLRRAQGRSVILACDTALKPLLRCGIVPDLVMSIDGTELNYRGFEGVDPRGAALVAEPMTFHRILAEFKGPVFVASFGNPVMEWVEKHFGPKGELRSGGSVSTAAFYLAYRLGANPIVLVGQDLSYPGGRTYAQGTFYAERGGAPALSREDMVEVPAVDGGTVLTPRFMYLFINWFEEAIPVLRGAAPGLEVIDATEGGALIRGTRVMTLAEALDGYFGSRVDVARALAEARAGYRVGEVGPFLAELEEAASHLKAMAQTARKGLKLVDRLERAAAGQSRPADTEVRRLLCQLEEIDQALVCHRDLAAVVEMVLQPTLFSIIRRRGGEGEEGGRGRGRAALQETRWLYQAVAIAGGSLARLLREAASRVKARAESERAGGEADAR
ncbi:MAG: DUF115 domain-containing protein [Acetobacteraceae bacterium]|nr:DUF115 domain-containing protein [Acetobacteraceae bacterium]